MTRQSNMQPQNQFSLQKGSSEIPFDKLPQDEIKEANLDEEINLEPDQKVT